MDMERRHGVPDYQLEQPEQQQLAVVVPVRRNDADGARQLFLDAGRVLMLWGWGALATAASVTGQKNDGGGGSRLDTSSAVHALVAFVVWLLGVSLVALVHVERRRFPRAARVGAAVANAVIDCFLVRPWN